MFSSYCNSSHSHRLCPSSVSCAGIYSSHVTSLHLFIFPPLVTARLLCLFTAEASKTKLLLVRKIIESGFVFLGSSVVLNLYSVQRSVGLLYRSQAPDGKHGVVKMKKTSVHLYMRNSDVYSC